MLPWDTPELIRYNLAVLASLKSGDKLSVLKDGEGTGGQFSNLGHHRGLRERFKVSTSVFARGSKGETITDRKVYLDPLSAFFTKACDLYRSDMPESRKQIGKEIEAAVAGIGRLRDTYFRQYKEGNHRTAAQELVDAINRITSGLRSDFDNLPDSLAQVKMPFADEWLKQVPQQYQNDPSIQRMYTLLLYYRISKFVGDRSYKRIFLRHDIYLATKGWLKRANVSPEEVQQPTPRHQMGGHRALAGTILAVRSLHQTAKTLLCKSLRANPSNLKAKMEWFFGRSVDTLNVNDEGDLQQNILVYLNNLERRKARLTFKNGLVYRFPFNKPDLQRDEEYDLAHLELADTRQINEFVMPPRPEWGYDQETLLPTAGFVVGHDRGFYTTQHISSTYAGELGRMGVKHSTYFAGGRVLFAGMIKINHGRIRFIGSGSGHYRPQPRQLLHCLEALLSHGVPLNGILVQDWPLEQIKNDDQGRPVAVDAMKYLTKAGKVATSDHVRFKIDLL